MGWRYRRSFKILPGVRVNVGSKGVTSWSFGGRGVRVNVGKRKTTTTYNLFGTGLSYQTQTSHTRPSQPTARVSTPPQVATPAASNSPVAPKRSSVWVYTLVGVAALITYAVLKPEHPASQVPATAAETASSTLQAPGSPLPPSPSPSTAVAAEQVSVPSAPSDPSLGEAVTVTGANVRSSASMSGSIVRVLDPGARVQVVGQEGSWRRVAGPDGEVWGWVHKSVLR